jgi:hypothetical protein
MKARLLSGRKLMSGAPQGPKSIRIEASEVLWQPGLRPTREQFLADPSRFAFAEGLQPEWIVEAFRSNEPFRENILYALSRSVCKGGDFSLASGWLELLATGFSPGEVVRLYTALRHRSERSEAEWHAEFEAAFPGSAGYLPKLSREEQARQFHRPLFQAVGARDLGRVRTLVVRMQQLGIRPVEVRMEVFAPPAGVDPEDLPVADCTVVMNAVEYAEFVGAVEVLAFLRERSAGGTET